MATLWIREYSLIRSAQVKEFGAVGSPRPMPMAMEPGDVDQSPVTFSTSAQSAAFGNDAAYIAIIASAAFHYVVGSNPTATTNHLKVPADTLLYIGVTPGQKIAAIAAA